MINNCHSKKVPIIIPIVIYYGKEVWNVETNLSNRIFAYIKQLPEEQVHDWFEGCMIYLLNVRKDITIEDILKVQKEIMPGRGEIVMTIAEKLRNEGKLEGERKGKLEERKEVAIKLLSNRFGRQLTTYLK